MKFVNVAPRPLHWRWRADLETHRVLKDLQTPRRTRLTIADVDYIEVDARGTATAVLKPSPRR